MQLGWGIFQIWPSCFPIVHVYKAKLAKLPSALGDLRVLMFCFAVRCERTVFEDGGHCVHATGALVAESEMFVM